MSAAARERRALARAVKKSYTRAIDDEARAAAYETLWLPMERAQGDGDAPRLERFVSAFVGDARRRLAQRLPPNTSPPRRATALHR